MQEVRIVTIKIFVEEVRNSYKIDPSRGAQDDKEKRLHGV
jgi:hypothetical protein